MNMLNGGLNIFNKNKDNNDNGITSNMATSKVRIIKEDNIEKNICIDIKDNNTAIANVVDMIEDGGDDSKEDEQLNDGGDDDGDDNKDDEKDNILIDDQLPIEVNHPTPGYNPTQYIEIEKGEEDNDTNSYAMPNTPIITTTKVQMINKKKMDKIKQRRSPYVQNITLPRALFDELRQSQHNLMDAYLDLETFMIEQDIIYKNDTFEKEIKDLNTLKITLNKDLKTKIEE
eukprot:323150_1